ncbi:uncharacterized protein [Blastocystis hominis]|uniref:Importin subunit alpha n=1 Tax=Blastocystis hominis TaxID=12968 RepID=D8M4S9_BLAHO|nr:uncharacterized protein [Blastocystis hominis]CBK23068.2 unnamed protein product [Blastocystis hominis]|eukprot:XP_012897116.1 uncharacterized protein [Blastocystis hominis]
MSLTFDTQPISNEELVSLCQTLNKDQINSQLDVLKKIRGAITMRNDSPYGLLIEQGIIPTLIVGLQCPSVNVNLECAWILGNIASGTAEQTLEVFYSGVGPILLNQLKNCKDKSYLSVALFFAGNLCGEDKCRNILVSSGIIDVVLQLLNKYLLNQEIMENCVFCLRNAVVNQNLLQNRGLSHLQLIQSLYLRLLTAPKPLEIHTGILSDVLQLVQSVLESNPVNIGMPLMKIAGECIKRMDASVTASIEERLEESLNYPTKSILETLGNIIAENDLYASYLLQNGYLAFLSRVYFDKNNGDFLLRLEVIFNWMNLSGGTCSQALYDTGILETLVGNVQALNPQSSSIEFEAARRSMVVICNFICECDDATRLYLLSCNVRGLLEQYLNLVQGRWQDEDHDFIMFIGDSLILSKSSIKSIILILICSVIRHCLGTFPFIDCLFVCLKPILDHNS